MRYKIFALDNWKIIWECFLKRMPAFGGRQYCHAPARIFFVLSGIRTNAVVSTVISNYSLSYLFPFRSSIYLFFLMHISLCNLTCPFAVTRSPLPCPPLFSLCIFNVLIGLSVPRGVMRHLT